VIHGSAFVACSAAVSTDTPGPVLKPHVPAPIKPWQRRSSPLARWGWLVYTLLLIDASLYPLAGWRDRGLDPFAYLFAPWPSYFTGFDIVVNVLGYIPLAFLAGLALYPKMRGALAALLAVLFCVFLSAGLEAVQTFLPSRVASTLDLVSNVGGALIGGVLAAVFAESILDRGRLRLLRLRWFERDASVGLVLTVLWFFAVLYPDAFAFGPGGILKPLFEAGLGALGWQEAWRLDPRHYVLGEALLAALSLTGAGALLLALMRPLAPRMRIILVFVALSVAAQALSGGLSHGQERVFTWLTLGSQFGVAIALFVLSGLSRCSSVWRARIGLLALAALILLTSVLPQNPYFADGPQIWAYGQYLNFYGLALGIHLTWPFFAFVVLLRPAWRGRVAARPL